MCVCVCVCVEEKVSRFPLCFLSPHLFLLFPRRGGDESQSHGVTLNFSARRAALLVPLPVSQIDAFDDRRRSGASATRRSDMSSTSGPAARPGASLKRREKRGSERPDWRACERGVKVTAERDKLLFDLIAAPA